MIVQCIMYDTVCTSCNTCHFKALKTPCFRFKVNFVDQGEQGRKASEGEATHDRSDTVNSHSHTHDSATHRLLLAALLRYFLVFSQIL